MSRSPRYAARAVAAVAVFAAVATGGCDRLRPDIPALPQGADETPAVALADPLPTFGPGDVALNQFDPEVVIRDVPGRAACTTRLLADGSTDVTRHVTWLVTCRRAGQDRTIYFDIGDAIEADLRENATIPK